MREFWGMEFDWFATDKHGFFALFATGGFGPIPEAVRAVAESHDEIGDGIEVTGWGSEAVWQSYARVGLYVYDWSGGEGCYVRVAEPSAPLSAELRERLTACPGLQHVPTLFSVTQQIKAGLIT